ncbi:MAG: reprolysin-like metallopeptidase [Ferruginibacter sp.]
MKKLLLFFVSFMFLGAVMAQKKNFWSAHTDAGKIVTDKAVARLSFPKEFKLFNLDIASLRQELFTVVDNVSRHSTVISLPNADGGVEEFEIFEASNFDAELQAQFPQIRAFSGKGITDKYATLKLSVSPQGIQTMVFRTDKENEFIEPYSQDHTVYAVFKSHRNTAGLPWSCSTHDAQLATGLNNQVANATTARSGGNLKTMRLAQSVTAEYSNYFGATSASQVSLVLAAINATLTRCNGVYEKDLALHLNLVAASTNVIYYNASTDPYDAATAGAGGTWNAQLMNTLHSVIGDANFDIGHLFGASGGGGNAGCIGCICNNSMATSGGSPTSYKGSGFTSPADGIPQGDNFDIDYVVHEVGHQMGANHTFTMSSEGGTVANSSQKEIGSGITIMGYAGITSQDVAPHSIDIYHEQSIAQIQANLLTVTCPVTTTITNSAPVVATVSNYTIPKSTPFALTGSATDADGDALTYCWEENDATTTLTGTSSVASATKASGPNWLSFSPTASPTRLFPKLSTILSGLLVTPVITGGDAGTNIEALSSVARTLKFRLTVRDNHPFSSTAPVSVGQTNFTDMVVTVSSASGPFAVSSPNTAVSYVGGSTQTITWAVASTTASPVSCANVKISLSTDGGQTFPTVLAASTANDGTEALVIPNTPTTTARIKVEAVGNIFFDISNANFTITAGSSCGAPTGLASSSITTSGATVSWTAVSGAVSYDVDYKLTSSGTWTNAATATASTSVAIGSLTASTVYDWRVRTNCASGSSAYTAAQFTTAAAPVCGAPSGLASSSITTSGATVNWTAVSGAVSYDVDYKLTSSGTWTNAATATASTSVAIGGLGASSVYDWRVRTNCSFGSSGYTAAQFTTAGVVTCNAPTGLSSSSITTSTATVSWTAASGAVSYAVDYKLNAASTWTSFSTAQTGVSASLTGLTASSLYDWRVTTNCSSGTSTAAAAQFTTATASSCATAFEPNETLATAADISSGVTNSAAISTATDIDYYKITISATSNMVYNLVGPSGNDYDLFIYNSAGTQLGSGETSTATETVSLSGQAAGTYYIKVFGYNGSTSATCYTIKATATTVTGCQSSYDVSTNGTTAGAAVIPFNTNITGLISPSADVDDYKFTITTAGTITVTLTTLPGDYDIKLLNSAGTQVGISQNGSTTSESISYTAAAGVYYVSAYGYNGANSATSCYTLKVQLGTATKQVTDVPVYAADKNIMTVYPNPVSDVLNIALSGEVNANTSFVMMDAKGVVVMQQKFIRNPQAVDISKLTNGVYLVKINNGSKVITEKFIKQ